MSASAGHAGPDNPSQAKLNCPITSAVSRKALVQTQAPATSGAVSLPRRDRAAARACLGVMGKKVGRPRAGVVHLLIFYVHDLMQSKGFNRAILARRSARTRESSSAILGAKASFLGSGMAVAGASLLPVAPV